MGTIHQLVLQHGREQARMYVEPEERPLVDIAAEVLSVESPEMGTVYTGFALTSLPHKKIPDDQIWERENGLVKLTISPGLLPAPGGKMVRCGVPYGAHARLLLIYLQTQAVRNRSREVELGPSLNAFLDRVGIPVGGKTYKSVREQLARIAAANLVFSWQRDGQDTPEFMKSDIIKGGQIDLSFASPDTRQGTLWQERVVLGEDFFEKLKDHPIPLLEQALKAIGPHSVALDVYAWLAYRLHHLKRPQLVRWEALYPQFGSNYARLRDFRARFIDPLKMAMAAYPEAKVSVDERGLTLYPSSPPIPLKQVTGS